MRESMGLTLDDDIEVALESYMLMHDFLSKAKKETIELTQQEKKLKRFSKKLNIGLSGITTIVISCRDWDSSWISCTPSPHN